MGRRPPGDGSISPRRREKPKKVAIPSARVQHEYDEGFCKSDSYAVKFAWTEGGF